MPTPLLDTNVVSYILRGDTRAHSYAPRLQGVTLAISFATVAELHEGAERRAWGPRRLAQLDALLRRFVVIPATPSVCAAWGRIRASRRAQPISENDAWIAACAMAYDCELLTHDRGFAGTPGLRVVVFD
jgi:predicted nucleic acid-binding protein